ncbi:MAG: glyoxalase [Flammeovirgaceae bacterium]|jgi:extradiol dioxygenase family protein|nr:glyoxalase [Flammeovirgaceae bacterium]MAR16214.1 glyoxalase [Flammeovirgaceae bacterium]|tara:strand:+ start:1346 stop:1762 length:417 start_codon:yes stop_codon:yes gene_type:complete
MKNPFHLAFPINDIEETKSFYKKHFNCEIGREDKKWVDFDFYGHQLSAHLRPEELKNTKKNSVDGKDVPVRHFGVILEWETWHQLSSKLKENDIDFIIDPYIRFKGEVGEQATMFFLDPSGNALEFKSFKDSSQVFAK